MTGTGIFATTKKKTHLEGSRQPLRLQDTKCCKRSLPSLVSTGTSHPPVQYLMQSGREQEQREGEVEWDERAHK
jgi:hypothetical protein